MTGLTQTHFSTRVLRTVDELVRIAPEWRELHQRCSDATPFQRPEWQLSWIEVFSPRELIVVEVRERSRLVGLAPLLIYSRDDERVLAFTGGGASDYLNVLLESGMESEVFRRISETLDALEKWTVLELTDLPRTSAVLGLTIFKQHIYEHDGCSVTLLPDTHEALLQCFSKRQRANLRNAHSRLQRAGGGEVEIATLETLPEFLEDLFVLHTSRWSAAGETGVLGDERIRHFYARSSPQLLASGCLRLYRLRVKGRTAAVIYCLLERETVFCYLQGFDPEFSFLSPGTLLMLSVMQDAVRLAMRRFDFLRGQEMYKQHWRPQPEATFRVSVSRSVFKTLTVWAEAA